jgi:hypothetical protein
MADSSSPLVPEGAFANPRRPVAMYASALAA